MLSLFIEQLRRSVSLSEDQVRGAVEHLVDQQTSAERKAEFLMALASKGETVEEITAFARELRAKSVQPLLDAETRGREILDVSGTGGDRLNTFNISTTVALVASAAGATVAKHGNRAITSQAGSADVLEELGVPIQLTSEQAAQSLRDQNFAFFFAPAYHPAFKFIGPARKLCAERGQRTIFNFLGPLLNPARPSAQLIGVPSAQLCTPMAHVLQSLGARRGMVVSGLAQSRKVSMSIADKEADSQRLDELSILGENCIAEFYQDHALTSSTLSPHHFPLQAATLADLQGGDRRANAETVRRLLRGEERGPKRDAVLLNCGAALFVAGKTKSIMEGWELAAEVIDSGRAQAKLESLAS